MLQPRSGPLTGLAVQVLLLAVVDRTVGLGQAGWLTGLAVGLLTCVLLNKAMATANAALLGPADLITLARLVLSGGVAALVADSFGRQVPAGPLIAMTAAALVLDAVDGAVARRTGTASALGARFDLEADAFLLLVLSVQVSRSVGVWVLAIGAMRYVLAAAAPAARWLNRPLPPRYWRKVVAATQGIALLGALTAGAAGLSGPAVTATLVVALALLTESFGRDVLWLWRTRPVREAPLMMASAGRMRSELGGAVEGMP